MMFQWDQTFCIKRKAQCYEDAANEVAHTETNVYYYTEKNTIMSVKSFEFVKKINKITGLWCSFGNAALHDCK